MNVIIKRRVIDLTTSGLRGPSSTASNTMAAFHAAMNARIQAQRAFGK